MIKRNLEGLQKINRNITRDVVVLKMQFEYKSAEIWFNLLKGHEG